MVDDPSTSGISVNPFNIIDAIEYKSSNAVPTSQAGAKDGTIAVVTGPNQVIFDTGYLPKDSLLGLHQFYVKWYSSVAGTLANGQIWNGLVFQYWKKDSSGNETNVYNYEVPWHDDISPYGLNWCGLCFFFEGYQYRIVIVSDSSISDTDWVGLDYIRMNDIDPVMLAGNYAEGGTVYNNGAPAVPQILQSRVGVSIAGGGYSYTVNISIPLVNSGADMTALVSTDLSSATVSGANPQDIYASLIGTSGSTITVAITNTMGANWSATGTVYVNCIFYIHEYVTPL